MGLTCLIKLIMLKFDLYNLIYPYLDTQNKSSPLKSTISLSQWLIPISNNILCRVYRPEEKRFNGFGPLVVKTKDSNRFANMIWSVRQICLLHSVASFQLWMTHLNLLKTGADFKSMPFFFFLFFNIHIRKKN